MQTLPLNDNRFCRMWVGLSDAASECGASWDCEGWSWTDGSPYDYTFCRMILMKVGSDFADCDVTYIAGTNG